MDAGSGLREIEGLVGTALLRACADLAEGRLAAAKGHHERARPLLEDAADAFERSGAPFEALQAKLELATSLLTLDRAEAAEWEITAALDRLRGLGAEAEAGRARAMAPPRLAAVYDRLERALEETHDGGLDPKRATAMANLARALAAVLQAGELEERVRSLEGAGAA